MQDGAGLYKYLWLHHCSAKKCRALPLTEAFSSYTRLLQILHFTKYTVLYTHVYNLPYLLCFLTLHTLKSAFYLINFVINYSMCFILTLHFTKTSCRFEISPPFLVSFYTRDAIEKRTPCRRCFWVFSWAPLSLFSWAPLCVVPFISPHSRTFLLLKSKERLTVLRQILQY